MTLVLLAALDVLRTLGTPTLAPPSDEPKNGLQVSVIVPARDEAHRIRPLLEGLAIQRYPRFEVIVVDDHSTDGTRALVESYASRIPHLRTLASAELPQGWVGKCWACAQGAQVARGRYLVFLDADVIPKSGLLSSLVQGSQETGAAFMTLLPLQRIGTWAERAVLTAFIELVRAVYPPASATGAPPTVAFGNGPCLFFRRDAYDAIGGHFAVRASLLEDMTLAECVRMAQYSVVVAQAPELLEVRMYEGWSSLSEGLTKNAVAGYRSGGIRSAWAGFRETLVALGPWLLLFTSRGAAFPIACAVASVLVREIRLRREFRNVRGAGVVHALGLMVYFGLAARGWLRLRRGVGLAWKGRVFDAVYKKSEQDA